MRRALVAAVVLAGISGIVANTLGDDAGAEALRRARVVARIGASGRERTILVGELEERIGEMPAFQRATFGSTPDAIRRAVLSEAFVRESLLSLRAEAAGLGERLPTSYALERARSGATIRAIRARIGPASAIADDDLRSYYEQNRSRYDAPERVQVWRILCRTREDALAVIDAVRSDPTPKNFGDLARDHSQDKASYLRAGNLGFLTGDGASNEPGLRVDPAILRAAQGVRDGDLVPTPVVEGAYFSVVWRRGTIAATKHALNEVAAQIRDTLWKTRIKEETDRLVATLRATRLRDVNDELLVAAEFPVLSDARDASSGR
jgi:peptidyl-prolyl cis-trans isomerase C